MYPVAFAADFQEPRSRLSTFFRLLLVLPWAIVAIVWLLGSLLATVGAWFAIVATGRYPRGLYEFNAKALRFVNRVNGFQHLLTDELPPFDGGRHPEYPVRLEIAPPAERYSRLKALFRIILLIPIFVVLYVVDVGLRVIGFLAWATIVLIGREPRGLFDLLTWCVAYQARATAYHWLMTETYPPLSPDDGAQTDGPAAAPVAG
jgi:hypothetical protein